MSGLWTTRTSGFSAMSEVIACAPASALKCGIANFELHSEAIGLLLHDGRPTFGEVDTHRDRHEGDRLAGEILEIVGAPRIIDSLGVRVGGETCEREGKAEGRSYLSDTHVSYSLFQLTAFWTPPCCAVCASRGLTALSSTIAVSRISLPITASHFLSTAQTKFAAELVSPSPLYQARCGYGQSGRCISIPLDASPSTNFVAMTWSGATPSSTQCESAVNMSCSGSRDGGCAPPKADEFEPVRTGAEATMAHAGNHEEPSKLFRLLFAAELAHEGLVEVDRLPDRHDRIGPALEEDQFPAAVAELGDVARHRAVERRPERGVDLGHVVSRRRTCANPSLGQTPI